jgi:hypothetical protein
MVPNGERRRKKMELGELSPRWPHRDGQLVGDEMQSAAEYRRYAAECERIARDSAPSHRAVLLDIAKAWRDCAVEAERQENAKASATDGKANAIDGKGNAIDGKGARPSA